MLLLPYCHTYSNVLNNRKLQNFLKIINIYQKKKSVRFLSSNTLSNLIEKLSKEALTPVSLQTLVKSGRGEYLHRTFEFYDTNDTDKGTNLVLIQSASFLRRELPIRLAHRIQDLSQVPFMRDMPSVKSVKDLYATSLLELEAFPRKIVNNKQESEFAKILQNIYERHAGVLLQMARGAFELRAEISSKKDSTIEFDSMQETHRFLDRFYVCRIGLRVLIGQYLALRQKSMENYTGIICTDTSPYEIVKRAIDDASFMCTRKYGESPDVVITGRLDLTFPYVPTHLHYIMLELLKNSMRATVDWHGIDINCYPPIKVIIADGSENEDIAIKVSDEGGGIPRSNIKKIWSYLFTTADATIQDGVVLNENTDHSIDTPLAGLGYGLPISRSYAQYFGGNLSIMSMEGYGTDAFVYLTRLGDSKEPLL